MTTAQQDQPTETAARPDRWAAVVAVSFGTFLLVIAEQLPIGLLTSVGRALSVSEGTAGLMVTLPSLVAGIAAPAVPLLVGRMNRRLLLVGLMALMTGANAVTALAPNFPVLLASRVAVGVAVGGFWAIAGGLAVRLVSAPRVPKATAIIFGGVGAANVLGVPIGTTLGAFTGWRTAFAALGVLALLVLVVLVAVLPKLEAKEPLSLSQLADQFRNGPVLAGIVVTFLLVTGHFAAYTYVSPLLQQLSGIDERLVGPLLFGFGIAGMVGNFVAGGAVARNVSRTTLVIAAALTATVLLYPVVGTTAAGGIVVVIAWGLVYGGVPVSLQTWMIKAAPNAVEAATGLWVAVFNLSIGLGAMAGGVIVDAVSLPGVLFFCGGCLALAAFASWRAPRA